MNPTTPTPYQDAAQAPNPIWESTEVAPPVPPSIPTSETLEEVIPAGEFKRGPSFFQIIIILLLIGVVITVAYIILTQKKKAPALKTVFPTPTPVVSIFNRPSATPLPFRPSLTPTPLVIPTVMPDDIMSLENDVAKIDLSLLK